MLMAACEGLCEEGCARGPQAATPRILIETTYSAAPSDSGVRSVRKDL
jgi:hypothetical protein